MKSTSRHLDLRFFLLLATFVPQINCVVPGRILEDDVDVGVGTAEEVPISSFTLTFSEPDIQIQRALPAPVTVIQPESQPLQEPIYDDLEEDYADEELEEESNFNGGTGEGSIESIPIESMRVRFEPAKFQATKLDSIEEEEKEQLPLQCTERCNLPVMPAAMVVAAEHCNVELVFHRPDFPVHFDNNSRSGRPTQEREPRRLDTSLRTACGSKCVLEQLNFLRESGVPDAEAVTRMLHENSAPSWEAAMLAARDTCTPLTVYPAGQVLEEKERCQLATTFMKCIRNTLTEHCPAEFKNKECQVIEQEIIQEEETNVN